MAPDSKSNKRKSGRHKATRRIADGSKEGKSDDVIPALRAVPAEMVSLAKDKKGQPDPEEMGIVLHDPDGFAPQPAVLSPGAYALATLFNGERTAKEIAKIFMDQYGQEVTEQGIRELAGELEKNLFLDSPKFEETVRQTLQRFLAATVRPATLADECYPSDPEALIKQVDAFFAQDGGPGALTSQPAATDEIHGMVLPHIDLRVGGATYAHGYKALLERCQADLFVVFGVAHRSAGTGLFNVSTKDYATPLGPAKAAKGIARRLQDAAGIDPAIAEYTHKEEHSIEFQAVMMSALLGMRAQRSYEIVPILCNAAEPFIEDQKNPSQDEAFVKFVESLRNELDKSGRKWCVLASVDLSHVGPKFGHATNITEKLLLPVERADRRMLKKVESLDPDAFYFEIARTKNSRHVDAVMAVLAMLAVGKGVFKKGRLLHYNQMLEYPTKSAVSFASMEIH
ncbi:MAG: AmmeMemoRadiSam system protein B [Planctomycetes bacterium]|nr:AmmeMemoRadiSam system protein B [Planctomycetota bacterium]